MPTQVQKMVCSICHKEFDKLSEANKCEARGLYVPYFKIRDGVTFKEGLGEGYTRKRTGIVKDILFPTCWKIRSGNEITAYNSLGHDYQVFYLVVSPVSEERGIGEYFAQDEILGTHKEMIVHEGSMFFENGDYINEGLDIDTNRSRRTLVKNWNDFVAKVVEGNPTLTDRMQGLTAFFQKKGII